MGYSKQKLQDIKRLESIAYRLNQHPNSEYFITTNNTRVSVIYDTDHLIFSYGKTNILVFIDKVLLSQGGNVYTCPKKSTDSILMNFQKAVMNGYLNLPETVNFKNQEVFAIKEFLERNLDLRKNIGF